MWVLILFYTITYRNFYSSGDGVAATSQQIDFNSQAKCEAALQVARQNEFKGFCIQK